MLVLVFNSLLPILYSLRFWFLLARFELCYVVCSGFLFLFPICTLYFFYAPLFPLFSTPLRLILAIAILCFLFCSRSLFPIVAHYILGYRISIVFYHRQHHHIFVWHRSIIILGYRNTIFPALLANSVFWLLQHYIPISYAVPYSLSLSPELYFNAAYSSCFWRHTLSSLRFFGSLFQCRIPNHSAYVFYLVFLQFLCCCPKLSLFMLSVLS